MKSILTNLIILSYLSAAALAQAQDVNKSPALPDIVVLPHNASMDAVAAPASDAGGAAREAADLIAVQRNLRLMYPKTRFGNITPTPLPGIYEVVMGRNVAFMEESGRYFIFGRLFDMEKQQDITSVAEQQQGATPPAQKVDFAGLPLDAAIKSVRGDGRRAVAVFSDPDCPYCKKLEQELAKVNDVTIYTFLMPLEQLHPESRKKTDAVWCSKDRAAAWTALMLDGKVPAKPGKGCGAPHDIVMPLAEKLGINGTPFMVAADGRTMPGAMPAAKLSSWLDAGVKPVAANDKGVAK